MPMFDPRLATRRKLKAGLVVAGALAGFGFGLLLTRLGKIVAGAPPATLGNYLWNGLCFAVIAAVCSPIISWSFLRRAPLWRTIIEPLLWMAAGGATAVVLGWPPLLLILPPLGLALGVLGLHRRYPDQARLVSEEGAATQLKSSSSRLLPSTDPPGS